MHVTILLLSLAYAIFTAPLLYPTYLSNNTPNNRLQITTFKVVRSKTFIIFYHFFSFQSMALYSWYVWMYAINVIIYVASSSYFRKVYRIFFADILSEICSLSRRVCFFRKKETSFAIELR